MLQFKIDKILCIGCGECVDDCPYAILALEDDLPVVLLDKADQCIACQHCLAVCPTGALSIFGKDPADSRLLKGNLPKPDTMATLIKGRRSVRRYKQESLEPGTIEHLLRVTAHAPTGVNNRGLLFTVVDRMEDMQRFRTLAMQRLDRKIKKDQLPQGFDFFKNISRMSRQGTDIIFRSAPHLLLVSSPTAGPTPLPDCIIGLSYFELLARSMGIGTLWNGFTYQLLTNILPELREEIGIPIDHTLGYAMSFGKPSVHYQRTVQRDDVQINRIRIS